MRIVFGAIVGVLISFGSLADIVDPVENLIAEYDRQHKAVVAGCAAAIDEYDRQHKSIVAGYDAAINEYDRQYNVIVTDHKQLLHISNQVVEENKQLLEIIKDQAATIERLSPNVPKPSNNQEA